MAAGFQFVAMARALLREPDLVTASGPIRRSACMQSGDEATVDGVSMQQGFMSQGGMVSIFQDFPMSPDMVSEVKVLTSNYSPRTARRCRGRSWR